MSASDFSAWVALMKERHRWTAMECARQLGCGRNQIARWCDKGAPAYIGLACAALAYGLPSWRRVVA